MYHLYSLTENSMRGIQKLSLVKSGNQSNLII